MGSPIALRNRGGGRPRLPEVQPPQFSPAYVRGNIQSDNYTPGGTTGYLLDTDGNLVANDATLRGDVTVEGTLLAALVELEEGDNLLTNPGFETDTSGWTGANVTLTRDTGTKRTGSASAKMVSTSGSVASITTPTGTSGYAVDPGKKYVARFYVNKTVSGGNSEPTTASVYFYDSAGSLLVTHTTSPVHELGIALSSWRLVAASGVAPSTAAFAAVSFEFDPQASGATYFVDDAAFFATSHLIGEFATGESGERAELRADGSLVVYDENDAVSAPQHVISAWKLGFFGETPDPQQINTKGTRAAMQEYGLIASGGSAAAIVDGPSISTWTPALTATTTNPTLGTGSSVSGRYFRSGNLIIGWCFVKFGTASVAAGSGQYRVSTPVTAEAGSVTRVNRVGFAGNFDSSATASHFPLVYLPTADTFGFFYPATWPTGTNTIVAHNTPWTWAASDELNFFFYYEAA